MSKNHVPVICNFLKFIGVSFRFAPISTDTFLPGLCLENGCLIIDEEKLLYPGDILHEAGHLATAAPDVRATMGGKLENNNLHQGGEIMAMAWSYAACIYLRIDPQVVFHPNGYKGAAESLINNFAGGKMFGQPLLQWAGMTYYDLQLAQKNNTDPFPHMINWLRLSEIDGAFAVTESNQQQTKNYSNT